MKRLISILIISNFMTATCVLAKYPTIELIESAQQKGELDYETALLYKFYYGYAEAVDLIPDKYISKNVIRKDREGDAGEVFREIAEKWNSLSQKTKDSMKTALTKSRFKHDTREPLLQIIQPNDLDILNKSKVSIKGTVKIYEVDSITSAVIEIGDSKHNISLTKEKYIVPEDTDALGIIGVLSRDYKDKPGLADLWSRNGEKEYSFSETLILPSTGFNLISVKISAKNICGIDKNPASKTLCIICLPKNKIDNNPPLIELSVGTFDYWTGDFNVYKSSHVSIQKVILQHTIKDENKSYGAIYLNDNEVCSTGQGIALSGRGFSRTSIPLQPGENTIEVVAKDEYGNTAKKGMKLYYENSSENIK